MKTILCLFAAGFTGVCFAGSPITGKVILLDNDQLIEGDIRREGDRYVIRRAVGETVIPAALVLDVVADRKAAFAAFRERCNLRDVDDRMRLIRWAMQNDMREEALAEAELLLKFRPDDQPLRQLAAGLRELKKAPAPEVKRQPEAPPKLPTQVLEVETPEYNRDAFVPFVSKVQPILMNACASCHAAGQGGNFKLVRTADANDRKATLHNLNAVLRQLKSDDLAKSPLLTNAITAHGKTNQPPLREQTLAFQTLDGWVRFAIKETPAPLPVTPIVSKPVEGEPKPMTIPMPMPMAPPKTSFGETSTSQPPVEPQTEPKDPFDPAIFNGTIR